METIGVIAGLATEVMKFVNNSQMRKHNEKMTKLEHEIREEKARGQESDDGKIEGMEQEFMVEANAFLRELAVMGAAK